MNAWLGWCRRRPSPGHTSAPAFVVPFMNNPRELLAWVRRIGRFAYTGDSCLAYSSFSGHLARCDEVRAGTAVYVCETCHWDTG